MDAVVSVSVITERPRSMSTLPVIPNLSNGRVLHILANDELPIGDAAAGCAVGPRLNPQF